MTEILFLMIDVLPRVGVVLRSVDSFNDLLAATGEPVNPGVTVSRVRRGTDELERLLGVDIARKSVGV